MTTETPPIIPKESGGLKAAKVGRWIVWFVWAYIAFVIVVLLFAFFLLLFNANPDNGFVEWVYRSADRAMEPFRGIFPSETTGNGSVVDFSVLFAILVYSVIAMVVSAFVSFLDRKIAEERSKELYVAQEQQRRDEAAAYAEHVAAQEAEEHRMAARQASAQQRTAEAAERLADQPPSQQSPPAAG